MIYYDFGFYLLLATVVTGAVVLIDKLKWRKEREAKGIEYDEKGNEKMPMFIDISRSFFPIILVVFLLRSFLYEPYRIPSGSMNPGLYDGDFILVNKFSYGIRMPGFNTVIIPTGSPKRGDVAVFHPPHEPQTAYIKRIIGEPGDRLEWNRGVLTITPKCESGETCQPIMLRPQFVSDEVPELVPQGEVLDLYSENLSGNDYQVLYKGIQRSQSLNHSWSTVVPEGQYFAMGDNRDGSADSRFWGFVDEDALIGRAAYKWLFLEFTEEPVIFGKKLPKGVSFGRVGSIE
ncbi:signal peptidase I [Kangiella aquimarina]|uniref:Signal peptidase I n=1 Tax=Kangiella aquimarina TaxID=261965 RepID=A0ABZ0X2Z0_9GAMM|nr:signal peptidase I [Kangiella aquimarina]WQG84965.1 signal peptidase I [Kangiella aquimarina]